MKYELDFRAKRGEASVNMTADDHVRSQLVIWSHHSICPLQLISYPRSISSKPDDSSRFRAINKHSSRPFALESGFCWNCPMCFRNILKDSWAFDWGFFLVLFGIWSFQTSSTVLCNVDGSFWNHYWFIMAGLRDYRTSITTIQDSGGCLRTQPLMTMWGEEGD